MTPSETSPAQQSPQPPAAALPPAAIFSKGYHPADAVHWVTILLTVWSFVITAKTTSARTADEMKVLNMFLIVFFIASAIVQTVFKIIRIAKYPVGSVRFDKDAWYLPHVLQQNTVISRKAAISVCLTFVYLLTHVAFFTRYVIIVSSIKLDGLVDNATSPTTYRCLQVFGTLLFTLSLVSIGSHLLQKIARRQAIAKYEKEGIAAFVQPPFVVNNNNNNADVSEQQPQYGNQHQQPLLNGTGAVNSSYDNNNAYGGYTQI